MDVYEAVKSRRAVRGFTDEPVSRKVLERVLSAAAWAPSGSNLQPWNIYVLTGALLAELKTRAVERVCHGDPWDERQFELYPPRSDADRPSFERLRSENGCGGRHAMTSRSDAGRRLRRSLNEHCAWQRLPACVMPFESPAKHDAQRNFKAGRGRCSAQFANARKPPDAGEWEAALGFVGHTAASPASNPAERPWRWRRSTSPS